MKTILLAALCVLVIAAAKPPAKPAKPTTKELVEDVLAFAPPEVRAIYDRGKIAKISLDDARTACVKGLEKDDKYRAATAELQKRDAALKAARESGSPQEKLDASAAWNKARGEVEAIKADAIKNDKGVAEARDNLARVTDEFTAALLKFQDEIRVKAAREEELNKSLTDFEVGKIGRPNYLRVIQVINKNTMICEYGNQWFWTIGLSTTGVVDGERFKNLPPMKITGTKKYDTAIGSTKTIFVLEKIER